MIAPRQPCPAYDEEFERVSKSEEIQQLFNKYRDIVDVIKANAGGTVFDLKYIHDTWDTLTIEVGFHYKVK
jgi:hypothetical protein